MNKTIKAIYKKLEESIQFISNSSHLFVKNPTQDFSRTRKLSLSEVLRFILTIGANSLNFELLKYFNDVPYVTSSALIQQRDKIKIEAFKSIFERLKFKNLYKNTFKEFHLLAGDGSAVNIARDPTDLETYHTQKGYKKGYNQFHLNALYDLNNLIYTHFMIDTHHHLNERQALISFLDSETFASNTIIILDRGYESYEVMRKIANKGCYYLIRVKSPESKSGILYGQPLRTHCEDEQEISLILTRRQTKVTKNPSSHYKILPQKTRLEELPPQSKAELPMDYRVIAIEYELGRFEYLATNLPSNVFTLDDFKELYFKRWAIETSFRDLKHAIGLSCLHSKKRNLVEQEIYAKMIMYNFCSLVTQQIEVDSSNRKLDYKANFKMAIEICKKGLRGKIPIKKVAESIRHYQSPVRKKRRFQRLTKPSFFKGFNYRVA
ncbi:MAG: IS4 family transposase [Lactococcus lactis]|jgi:hypothetical protein|nr:IS4 family transposase [Lactococcus lactis]